MKWKIAIGLISVVLLITLIGTGIYQLTVGEAKGREQEVVKRAEKRLTQEIAPDAVTFENVFNGKDQYTVFSIKKEGEALRAFVPSKGKIETRPVKDGIKVDEVIRQSRDQGKIVSTKYGFEDRALIEIVAETETGYEYSYYTYQEGSFIKRLRIN
ncbi:MULTISPECIES: hypothetical protein [unclassified Exiguobacterium]|uniref:hypothetical protein n=1 Tax=unclassified Exiguobacterium TaxID=2644629 RepID=UPI001BEA1513|nr:MULTISPECIES: hypothetical protein [unclassified Exiguobacterium]